MKTDIILQVLGTRRLMPIPHDEFEKVKLELFFYISCDDYNEFANNPFVLG